jgi:hypothetical protein
MHQAFQALLIRLHGTLAGQHALQAQDTSTMCASFADQIHRLWNPNDAPHSPKDERALAPQSDGIRTRLLCAAAATRRYREASSD